MFEAAIEYSSSTANSTSTMMMGTTKKKKSKNKRRFSDEQIRSLEVMFESETKLEPKKKLQLARDLGLQPRQVAIWFQNKRARWKSKHIEKEYSVLLSDYNALTSQFDSLRRENQSLLNQLQKLKSTEKMLGNCDAETGRNGKSVIRDFEQKNYDVNPVLELDQDNEFLKMVDPTDSSLTSVDQDWGSLDSDDLIIDQPSDQTYEWWDFWS